mmetsp:Transcript_57437/g.128238  ORF Transcript_57437/g.128238 Transcript_57437/m.128238 type:complete len:267 (+) Transcript_57437:217-1017(+)
MIKIARSRNDKVAFVGRRRQHSSRQHSHDCSSTHNNMQQPPLLSTGAGATVSGATFAVFAGRVWLCGVAPPSFPIAPVPIIARPRCLNSSTSACNTHSVAPSASFATVFTSPHSSTHFGWFSFSSASSSLSDFSSGSFSCSPSACASSSAIVSSSSPRSNCWQRASTPSRSCPASASSLVRLLICFNASPVSSPSAASCESIQSPTTASRSGMSGKPANLPPMCATLSTVSESRTYGIALATHTFGKRSSKPWPLPSGSGLVGASL